MFIDTTTVLFLEISRRQMSGRYEVGYQNWFYGLFSIFLYMYFKCILINFFVTFSVITIYKRFILFFYIKSGLSISILYICFKHIFYLICIAFVLNILTFHLFFFKYTIHVDSHRIFLSIKSKFLNSYDKNVFLL